MESTSQLKSDHRLILRGLEILRAVAHAIQRNEPGALTDAKAVLNFFHKFADHCHHEKEETILFPALIEKGLSRDY